MRPESEAELSELIRSAERPLTVLGGATRALETPPEDVLHTSGLTGVVLYEPGALTLVVRAGTGLAEIETLLASERQRLSFEVPDLRGLLRRNGASTIGGVVASNASGPRRVQSGACRDSLLGVRFVDGRGDIVKNGGRVMKNVTGYDLVKLMAGSRGSLGVLTEVSLRVQALADAEVTLACACGAEAGLAHLQKALGSPFDVSGAAYAEGRALLRIEGMAGSVAYRAAALRAHLGGDWQEIPAEQSAAVWSAVRDVSALAARDGSVWRLVVTPTAAAGIAATLGGHAVFDWGGGLIWALTEWGQAARVRAAVGPNGHATLVRASTGDAPQDALPPEPAAIAALTRGLKAQFDPRQIFKS